MITKEIDSRYLGENKEHLLVDIVRILNKTFKSKTTGKPFNRNDVASYLDRGYIPYIYGKYSVTRVKKGGTLLIRLNRYA